MKKAILATKVGMTQIFSEDGTLTPVTVLQAGPCAVTQVKTVENDGYSAVQVGFVEKKDRIVNKDKMRTAARCCRSWMRWRPGSDGFGTGAAGWRSDFPAGC